MTTKVAKPAEAMLTIRNHVRAAMDNCVCFQRIGFTDLGFPKNPTAQTDALRATIDELHEAVRLMRSTRWPNEEEGTL